MKIVTTLEEIRLQAQPEIIEIPGFRMNSVINIKIRLIDLTPKLLELRIANPMLIEAQKLAQGGMSREEVASKLDNSSFTDILSLLDVIVREAIVEPTYEEIIAIHPLTLPQKLKIFTHVIGEGTLDSFRDQ